ncbi:MAG: MOSC domain-containing protein YiiM [Rhodothermales bacterium]|jgi:MOSC domain-containing protein YiiM
METRKEARAVPGRGLDGDRYYFGAGSLSRWSGHMREVTLIADEALTEMEADAGIGLSAAESRRNILVSGVPLNDLVKVPFFVGGVEMEGVRLCQPCKYLARKTGKDVLPAMIGRGGLRARILSGGMIRVGDSVTPSPGSESPRPLP